MKRKRVALAKTLVCVVAGSLMAGCGGSDSDTDALPQISMAGAVAVKEKKSVTITAIATDDKSISTYQWQQVSGPALTLAQDKTAAVLVTAPAVDADGSAVLQLTVVDSGGQSVQKNITVSVANNKLPVVSVTTAAAPEKAKVEFTVTASDSDGAVAGYAWTQTAGPAVVLTGATTAKPSFIAPAVTADTTLSFSVKVTDDDQDFNTATGNISITQKFVSYTINGTAPANAFANADVVLSAAGKDFSGKTNAQGNFSVVAKTDDDAAPASFGTLQVKSATVTGAGFYAFLRDIKADTLAQATSAASTTSALNTLKVNEVSTALFALITQANNGVIPANINSYLLLENALVADELIEAAAVAKIAAQGVHKLPPGNSLLDLLMNNAAYSAYVTAVEAAEPGAIAKSIEAITADPTLTPPMNIAEIPSAYYETYAAAGNFLARNTKAFYLNKDGSGSMGGDFGLQSEKFSWSLVDGSIELNYAANSGFTGYLSTNDVRLQFLGAATIKLLKDNNIPSIEFTQSIIRQTLKRLVHGQKVDSFRVTTQQAFKISPINVAGQVIDPPEVIETISGDGIFRNGDNLTALRYTAAEVNASRLTVPHHYAVPHSEMIAKAQVQSDLLEFYVAGNGKGLISEVPFSWQVSADGKLTVTFVDGDKTELTKFDEGYGYHTAIIRMYNLSGMSLGESLDWVLKHDVASLHGKNGVNQLGSYWQAMINLWRKDCWRVDQLMLKCSLNNFSHYFGWELKTMPDGAEHTNDQQGKRNSKSVSWETDRDYVVIKRNMCGNADCSRRIWWPLKDETTNSVRRVWTLEANALRALPSNKFDISVPFRVTAFEERPLGYPDTPTPQDISTPRMLIEPTLHQTENSL